MKLNSLYHGEISYREEDIILFPFGIPGFESLRKFIISPIEGNDEFFILQSLEDNEIGLIVTNPFIFLKEYEVNLPEHIITNLNIKSPEEVIIYTTVSLNSNIENITSNFKAPIIINNKEKLGEQYIKDGGDYSLKHPLFKGVI